jgi:hypothetical protein
LSEHRGVRDCRSENSYRAIAAADTIFGGLDHDVSFVFGGALFGCFTGSLRRRDRAASITQCIAFALAHRCRRRPKTKNIIVPLGPDHAAMGQSFDDLKDYQRCP